MEWRKLKNRIKLIIVLEKKLFQEISGARNKYHSALLTSFSFDFHHFESQVLKALRQKGISNVSVLVDSNMLEDTLGVFTGNAKYLNNTYSISGVHAVGAFHPKINLIVGENNMLLFFGSGNITVGGHGKNHELFTGFLADSKDSEQLPLIAEAFYFLKKYSINLNGISSKKIIEWIPNNCSLFEKNNAKQDKHIFYSIENGMQMALIYTDESSIFDQLSNLIPASDVDKITIVSPYYDENGGALNELLDYYKNATISAFLPEDKGIIPFKMKTSSRINFFSWESTVRGKKTFNSVYRKLHSKIFHFNTAKNEYCLIGSANATMKGLGGLNKRGINVEFGVLYKTTGIDVLKELGLNGRLKKTNLNKNNSNKEIKPSDSINESKRRQVFISSADMIDHHLVLYFSKNNVNEEAITLGIFNSWGETIFSKNLNLIDQKEYRINLSDKELSKGPSYLVLLDAKNELISNKQIINDFTKLLNTDPSRANHTIRNILYKYEMGEFSELDLIEFHNTISEGRKEPSFAKRSPSDRTIPLPKINPQEMTYEEAVEASKDKDQKDHISRNFNSIRIWSLISHLFLDNLKEETSQEDMIMEEEELGNPEDSHEREVPAEDETKTIDGEAELNRILENQNRMIHNYVKSINRIRIKENYQFGNIDFAQYLLITYLISAISFSKFQFRKVFKGQETIFEDELMLEKLRLNFNQLVIDSIRAFLKLLIGISGFRISSDIYIREEQKRYRCKSINMSILCLYISSSEKNDGEYVKSEHDLLSLNLIEYLGTPEEDFNDFILSASVSKKFGNITIDALIRYKDSMLANHASLKSNEKYFKHPKHGICEVLEVDERNKKIKFRSPIYDGLHGMSIKDLKRLR